MEKKTVPRRGWNVLGGLVKWGSRVSLLIVVTGMYLSSIPDMHIMGNLASGPLFLLLLLLLWGIPHLVLWFAGEVFCEYCRLRAQTAERVSLTEYLLGEGVREKLRRMAVRHAVTGWVVMLAMLVLLALLLLFLELGPSLIGFYTVYN